MMSREQADALARLLHELRPEWDRAGIFKALGNAKSRNPFDAAVAALRWTANPECRTPGGMGLPGPHWDERIAAPQVYVPPKREEACPLHQSFYRDSCGGCAAERKGQDTPPLRPARTAPPEVAAQAIRRAREALRPKTEEQA